MRYQTVKNFIWYNYKKFFIGIIIFIPIIFYFIPVKFAIDENEIDITRQWYIVKFDFGVTGGGCYTVDSWDGQHQRLYYYGSRPSAPVDYLETSITQRYQDDNRYVVYRDSKKEDFTMEDWEILSDIKGGSHDRYLNIYDFKWLGFLENNHLYHGDALN